MRSLIRRGWLSNEHGAWVMTALPIAVGICTLKPQPIQFLLLAAWTAAYCSYHALTLFMAAAPKRRKTYLPAMATWAVIAAACGIPVIILHPRPVARILIPVTIFCAIATFEAWRKRRRSLPSHLASVLASSCTYPLSVWVVADDYSPLELGCHSLRQIVNPRRRGHTDVRRQYCLAPSDTRGRPCRRCDPRGSALVLDRFYRAFYASDHCSRITKFLADQASPRGHWDRRISGLRLDV